MVVTVIFAITRSSACCAIVRVHQILEGTNEVMRLIVSRAMLGN